MKELGESWQLMKLHCLIRVNGLRKLTRVWPHPIPPQFAGFVITRDHLGYRSGTF